MSDKLIRFALVWALVGILVLIIVADFYEPKTIKTTEISHNVGKIIKVQGEITSANYYETVNIFNLKDDFGSIKIVIFEKPDKLIRTKDKILVKGKVSIYKGELQIIADEIICVRCKE